jgi:hypothetical protein
VTSAPRAAPGGNAPALVALGLFRIHPGRVVIEHLLAAVQRLLRGRPPRRAERIALADAGEPAPQLDQVDT